jgi:nucleotide-binding universal stress UspA family protein
MTTHTIRRILVPVDFSAYSERATQYACQLAARFGARVELLHVVEDPFLSSAWSPDIHLPDPAQILDDLVADASVRLSGYAPTAERRTVAIHSVVLRGQAARMIVAHAAACDFDLIVMGTHGRAGLSHFLLGSVTERVLRTAACPVLTIKLPGETRPATEAAFAHVRI